MGLYATQITSLSTVQAFFDILSVRQRCTAKHSIRVSKLAMQLGKQFALSKSSMVQMCMGTLLHDIGKLAISDDLLNKPGKLTSAEFDVIKKHSLYGFKLLQNVRCMEEAKYIVLYHHERYDGTGYPLGVTGEKIPLPARICATADALEAMISDRPYRKAISWERALQELQRNSGTQFDPNIVACLCGMNAIKPEVHFCYEADIVGDLLNASCRI